jgi:hypothetical protein
MNGNDTTTLVWDQGESPVIEPLDPVHIDDPFQYTMDEIVDLQIYQLHHFM